MRANDRAILVRMVLLSLLVMVLFSGYAAFRRLALSPPDGRVHIDAGRVAHLRALLHAIQPVAALSEGSAGEACPAARQRNAQQRRQDVAELNLRLERLAAGTAPFLTRSYRLNGQAWLTQAATLPGGCERAAETLGALLWADRGNRVERQVLTRLEWREQVQEAQWNWGDQVYVTVRPERLAQANPWRSLPGCVLLAQRSPDNDKVPHGAANLAVQGGGLGWLTACEAVAGKDERGQPASIDSAARSVPRDIALLAADLDAWRDPQSSVYRKLVGAGNTLRPYGGRAKPVGLHVLFTFDPVMQRIAQTIAECYVGDASACGEMGIPDPGEGMVEGARVRQVGIAVLDVPSGEVRVAASAESRCFRSDVSGVGQRPADCPDFGSAARAHYRHDADALRNHALFTVAPPGSTIKPIMAAGFLQDPGFAKTEAQLVDRVKHSNSRIFLDWMFCRAGDARGAFAPRCPRPALIQSAAHTLGWNAGCDIGVGCGRLDILFGRPSYSAPTGFPGADRVSAAQFKPSSRHVVLGRLLVTEHDERLEDMSASELQPLPDRLGDCAVAKWDGGAKACRKPGLGAVSEGYGQGSADATPVGVAAMMAQLAASADHGAGARYPHVVRELLDAKGEPDPAGDPARWGTPTRPPGIDGARARLILGALEQTHRPKGTASGGCRKVFGQDCGDLGVAGKTGTTTFGAEYARLAGFQKAWRDYKTGMEQYRKCAAKARGLANRCRPPESLPPRPWRWYAGVFKSEPAGPQYDKAFAVLVERNWTAAGGIDQLGGEFLNSAAIEIGFHLIAATRKAQR